MHTAKLLLKPAWPYDEALVWMAGAKERVLAGGPMEVAVGSHAEEVVTLGRHAPPNEILNPGALEARGAIVRRIDRGGGSTAHGPGQIVLYPVVSLRTLGLTVPAFTRVLEETVVRWLAALGVESASNSDDPGVYVAGKKIASLGFRSSRGVVTHGLAVNVMNDLSLFSLIAPCGMPGRPVTSLSLCRACGEDIDLNEQMEALVWHFSRCAMLEFP